MESRKKGTLSGINELTQGVVTIQGEMKTKKRKIYGLMGSLVMITVSIIIVLPFIYMISSSLKTEWQVSAIPPQWIPNPVVWSNYVQVWIERNFLRYLLNSVFVGGTVTVAQLFICSLAAFAFARLKFPGRDKIFLVYLATMMIPFHVRMIPLFVIMVNFRWANTYYALIVPEMFYALGVFLLRQFFLSIPGELEDAAKIDGCSSFGIYWKIFLPLSKPAIATFAVVTFLFQWNSFIWPLIAIDADEMRTLPLGLAMFQFQQYTSWALFMAGAVVTVIPIVVFFLCMQRYFIRGITLTGFK